MTFQPTFDIGHILMFVGFLATAYTIWDNTKAQRAQFLLRIFNSYPEGEDVDQIHRSIDAGEFEWDEHWWDTPKDTAMAGFLWYYDIIAYILSQGVLRKREREAFMRDREALKASKGVRQYIKELTDKQCRVNTNPFPYLTKWLELKIEESSISKQ